MSSLGDVEDWREELVGEMRMGGREAGERAGEEDEGGAPPRKPQPLLASRSLPLPLVSVTVAPELDVAVRLGRPTEKTRASPEPWPLSEAVEWMALGSVDHEPCREGRLKSVSIRSVALRSASPEPPPRRVGDGELE